VQHRSIPPKNISIERCTSLQNINATGDPYLRAIT
jgi:hypothetical protein